MQRRLWRHVLSLLILLGGLVALPAFPAQAAAPSGWKLMTPADVPNTSSIALQSNFSRKAVSAEIHYGGADYGMLRARAAAIGPWERYNLLKNLTTGVWAIQSKANGKYVTAEQTYTGGDYGMLRARATAISVWELYNATPEQRLPVEQFSRSTTMQSSVGSLEYAFVDNIGRLMYGRQTDPDNFGSLLWAPLGGGEAFTGQPVLGENADGRVQVTGHNTDTDVWVRTQTAKGSPDWGAWIDLASAMTWHPTVGRLPDGTLVGFAVDPQGQLWVQPQSGPNGTYLGWGNLGAASLAGTPTVVTTATGIRLFALDTSGAMKTASYASGALSTWTSLGGSGLNGSPAAVVLPGYIVRVFVRGADGTILTKQQGSTGTFPAAWDPVGVFTAAGSPSAVLSPVSGKLEVVARGADGHIYNTGETEQASGIWRSWNDVTSFDTAATDPTAFTYANASGPTWAFVFRNIDQATRVYTVSQTTGLTATAESTAPPTFSKQTIPQPKL
jgi:hypothetical protein